MIYFEIAEDYRSLVDPQHIEEAAKAALRHQAASVEADLTVVITSDGQMRELNRQYRDIDAPTDVLSFPADFTDPENEIPYLGDIIISFPRAEIQSAAAGHSTVVELQLLVVHGILHLQGHDHADMEEQAEMWAAQKEILRQLGLENITIASDE
jgi:probable rRNA maturation factor